MKCKICKREFKNKIGLARHLSVHNINAHDYYVKFNILPKCICGKNVKHENGKIKSTCGKKECISQILRIKRLKYMKEHPEETAWRKSNLSYPEKIFKDYIENNELNKKYLIIREYPIFPYFIDFAFINEKVAIEIDGTQHLLPERKKVMIKKINYYIITNG